MRHEIRRQNEDALYQQRDVRIVKMAIGSVGGLLLAAAIFVSFSFSLLTSGVLVFFALLAALIATILRD